MNDLTRLLNEIEHWDDSATERLFGLVYRELRNLAAAKLKNEKPGQTLQATALVHEAYLRLVGSGSEPSWNSRAHFFVAASEAMRRILVEGARRKQAAKRGGALARQDLNPDEFTAFSAVDPAELLAVHEALELLAKKSPRKAELVKCRYFLGCTMAEAAEILGIAKATAEEDWAYAKSWLRRELRRNVGESSVF